MLRRASPAGQSTEESLRLLADAGALLASTLDYDRILENVAHLIVPRFASWCIIDMVEDDGHVRRFTVVSDHPEQDDIAQRFASVDELNKDTEKGAVGVIREGESVYVPTVEERDLDRHIADDVTRDALRDLGARSLIIVPIAAKGLICGAIYCIAGPDDQPYSGSDLLLAEDLARRTGVAIDNARHYARSQEIATDLRIANEAKDEFLGLISHELRTPITVIHGGARILRLRGDRLDDDKRNALIADIEEEADRLHRIVENLLALSRAQLKDEFEAEPVLLQRVVTQIADTYRRRQRRRNVEVDAPDDFPAVAADQGYIEQILRNLISNADKYSGADSAIEIRLTRAESGGARVQVLDRGQGVPEEDLDRIFDRFYRSRATSATAGGAGMGLAVCRRLIDAMAGTIEASPRPGGGLAVEFTVPLYEG